MMDNDQLSINLIYLNIAEYGNHPTLLKLLSNYWQKR